MNQTHHRSISQHFVRAGLLVTTLLAIVLPARAAVDDNLTRQVWKLKHKITDAQLADPAWLALDSDGDGVSNGDEIAAGTNPFVASSTIKVSTVAKVGNNVDVSFPTELGKRYRVETTATLGGTWTLQPQPTPVSVVGDGNLKTLTVSYAPNNFYRVRVDDIDSDGDGVSDWAERVLGLNPNNKNSSPGGGADGSYVGDQVTLPSEVNIKADVAFASEDGPTPGYFTVTRKQKLFPITVNLTPSGTAVVGSDYSGALPNSGLPSSVTFDAGVDSISVPVNPIQTSTPKGSRSVIASLVAPGGGGVPPFTLGANAKATVIINPSTTATGTGLLARYYDTASSAYTDAANFGQAASFTYTRVGASAPYTGSNIVIPFTYNGTPALQVGHQVKLAFSVGSLNSTTYNNLNYTVTAVTPGVNFTVGISGTALPTSYNGICVFSIQSFLHPGTVERIDPTINFDWQYGTPNGAVIAPNNSADNYSDTFETYLSPTTAGSYVFQLDADDKARVLLDTGGGLTQILEHNWTSPGSDTVGTFKQSAPIALSVPASAAQRYKMRVEHVETTGDARCRLQWSINGGSFANIPQANQFTHTQTMTYSYSGGNAVITPSGGHSFNVNNTVTLAFTTGVLSTPGTSAGTYTGTYTISAVNGTTYTVPITAFPITVSGAATTAGSNVIIVPSTAGLATGMAVSGAGLPANEFITGIVNPTSTAPGAITVTTATGVTAQTSTTLTATLPAGPVTGSGYVLNNSTSTTTGVFNLTYPNTTFAGSPGRIAVDNAVTTGNNGLWNSGTPGASLIQPDTFSARWTGQVQPQYSEDYTFVVQADDGCSLWLNGQLQEMKTLPSTITGIATYDYSTINGDAIINYTSGVVKPGSFIVGEIVRVDPSTGNLTHGTGSTYTFDGVTGYLTVDYSNLTNITPGGFVPGETIELDPTAGTLSSLANLPYVISDEPTTTTFRVFIGAGIFDTQDTAATINIADTRNSVISKVFATGATYSYNSITGDMVVTYSAVAGVAPNSFTAGMTVELDPTSATAGTLSTLTNASYTIKASPAPTATTFTVNVGTSFTTCTGNINIASSANGVIPASITNAFAINFGTAKYSTGTGSINVEIANKPLKEWSSMGNERYVHIPMLAGVRYDIQLDFWENTGSSKCILSWYSASQPKQIIPSERLYPSSGPVAPAAHITSTDATALEHGGFSLALSGSNGSGVTLSDKPDWLNFTGGVLSGTPPTNAAGDYQVLVTTANAAGTSTSVVNLHVAANSGTVVREYWNNVTGTTIAGIPTTTTPTGTQSLPISPSTSLEAPTDFGDNYGARIRGYITAPVTGNYYFWLAASNAAELWISNDDEPINAFKRAWVTAGSTTSRTWNIGGTETGQKSPWLALEQGKKYYFEILHKASTGTGDNLAVGWAKPGEAVTAPSEVVPGYALSTYIPPAPGSTPGTLYVSTMLSQNGAVTNGVGNSTLRLSEDETYAIMTRTYFGLTGPITSEHIHVDPYLNHPSAIVFDIDQPDAAQVNAGGGPQSDGSYKWVILDMPGVGFTAAEIREIIKEGKAYINLHTAAYGSGEIRGNYTLAVGSRTFTPPPAPPAWTDDHNTNTGAARFLAQATFGPNIADITALKGMASYEAWIDAQFGLSTSLTSHQLPEVIRTEKSSTQGSAFDSVLTFNAWWRNSITGPDQLRQRIAFALSEIHVVSAQGPLDANAPATSYFYDKLADNAFGNFLDILKDTTLTPAMGRYLDMLRNDKPDQTVGRIPNENYAREIKQLFSVGLYRMWPDGTLMLTSKDAPIDTYTQREIVGLAHVFTGWDYGYDGPMHTSFSSASNWTRQMRETPARHYTGPKRLLNNEVLPGLPSLGTQTLDPYATHTFNNYTDPAYQALPAQELNKAHELIFNHPNVGPFICRQLIQRLVTSNPSRDYLYRVVQKFNDNGSGVRGDMQAVIKAILLDYEARSLALVNIPAYGKQREPIMRVAAAGRAFLPATFSGTYTQSDSPIGTARNITVTTSTPHKLVTGNNVFLEFTSGSPGPAPWIGSYSATVTDATHFIVTAQNWISTSSATTYSQALNSNIMHVTLSNHWLQNGDQAYFVFTGTNATGTLPPNGIYTVSNSNCTDNPSSNPGTTFDITVPADTAARTGGAGSIIIPRFSPGSYSISASGLAAPNDRRVTMDTNSNHELNVGDQVQLNFYDAANIANKPANYVATVESVVDLNTWTFLAPSTNFPALHSYDAVYQFPLKSLPLTRSGNVGSRPSTFALGNTTADLEQTPLSSPTVFNFFLPDFKYPGSLASQGITTPEFQLTAETTAIRQANYLYNGVFNPTSTSSVLSSFKDGSNSLVMDLSPWVTGNASDLGLGAPADTAVPWTHNQNIPTLINQLTTLLMANQMSSNVKAVIQNFIARPIASIAPGSPNTNPCVVTTVGNHGYTTGDTVLISGVTGGTFSPSGTFGSTTTSRTITVTGPDTFTVTGVTCTVAPTDVATAHVSPVVYNMGTTGPGNDNRRDRLRSIIHLILTSPDFTIQR